MILFGVLNLWLILLRRVDLIMRLVLMEWFFLSGLGECVCLRLVCLMFGG